MTFKNRTDEFTSFAESIRERQQHKVARPKGLPQKSQFQQEAAKIGKQIYETSEKLNNLTKLARRSNLFEDKSEEIEELTFIIKQDIQALNRGIAQLRDVVQSSTNAQTRSHSDTVIGYLQTKLALTSKDFKDVLQIRTESLKVQQERKQRFTGGGPAPTTAALLASPGAGASASSNSLSSPMYKTNLDDLPESSQRGGGDVAISMPGMMLVQQVDHTGARAHAVETIEKTLHELSGVFQELTRLVALQGDQIQRIDSNIDNTAIHVDGAYAALVKHIDKIKSNRWLIVQVFLVLIVFIVVFVVFFA